MRAAIACVLWVMPRRRVVSGRLVSEPRWRLPPRGHRVVKSSMSMSTLRASTWLARMNTMQLLRQHLPAATPVATPSNPAGMDAVESSVYADLCNSLHDRHARKHIDHVATTHTPLQDSVRCRAAYKSTATIICNRVTRYAVV
ncbi:hypothetical protein OH76DRAFT_248456 [Lentinus brumalis]|uniref:Uncharacterized protein n=1 Tax=Lentinus brumalis TaxID=2498619 RepID=A0A371CLK6_9APHY|nr:hypothetical protein OH76DRAFT_248456 [Polyporus brumalis]